MSDEEFKLSIKKHEETLLKEIGNKKILDWTPPSILNQSRNTENEIKKNLDKWIEHGIIEYDQEEVTDSTYTSDIIGKFIDPQRLSKSKEDSSIMLDGKKLIHKKTLEQSQYVQK